MARPDPGQDPDTETTPRQDEAAHTDGAGAGAAPKPGPDGAGGSDNAVPLQPRTRPARTPSVNVSETKRDTRAGPGDAGGADRPTDSPERFPGRRDMWRRALLILAVVALAWLVLSYFAYV